MLESIRFVIANSVKSVRLDSKRSANSSILAGIVDEKKLRSGSGGVRSVVRSRSREGLCYDRVRVELQ